MSNAKKNDRPLEGYYNFYGIPACILKQRNGAYASGFFDPIDGIFKAGGSAKKILWDGIRLTEREAKKLIREFSRELPIFDEEGAMPEWILLPDEASVFLDQSDTIRGLSGITDQDASQEKGYQADGSFNEKKETLSNQDVPKKDDSLGNEELPEKREPLI